MKQAIDQGANILWVDFLANGIRLADPEKRRKLADNAKRAGITHIVVDAKIPYGHTTYPSEYAYHVSRWSDGRYDMWKGRDFLQEMIDALKDTGLQVLANIDVFAEGTGKSRDGLAYDKKQWQVMFYNPSLSSAPVAAENVSDATIFVNPIHPEVIRHELAIIEEVTKNYKLDGVVLDRCRYPNIYGDFSELSRQQFEQYIGQRVEKWPEHIFTVQEGTKEIEFGQWFGKWTEWRALNIKNFVKKAKQLVKSLNPELSFSIYVGSWYPLYYNEGVNWGSETYHPELPWASEDYHRSGYADELDFLMTGCYYPEVSIEEAEQSGRPASWYSVEGAIDMSLQAVNGQIPVVASLFLKDYDGNPEQFKKAVRMCKQKSHGVMLFDVVYLENYNWWEALDLK
ncbi:alpha amylase family protein [Paenibacillus faecalis]|uniref:alpha amylase family protein n=1 Tax=Paenibacillus faecalis TaxID=2079532 RepID=UPI000D0F198A|nr:alpha amylase family protein [Paenibacillus faecalis]